MNQTPEFPSPEWFKANAYLNPRQLPDGSWAALLILITTISICVDITEDSWRRRYCYRDWVDADAALQKLTSRTDEPRGWIATRPER